jgi:hypothetical protein
MPPSIVNLLWLNADHEMSVDDLNEVITTLRGLAEQKDNDFFSARGFESATHFLKHFRQLSGIVLRQSDQLTIWLNALARHQTPPDIVRAIQRLPIG